MKQKVLVDPVRNKSSKVTALPLVWISNGVDVANRQKKRLPIRRIKAIAKEVVEQESGVKSRESGVKSQGSGVRGQELGVGSWELGVGSRESGVGSQESRVKSRESGVRRQQTADSRQQTADSRQETGDRRQESRVKSQESRVGSQESGVKSQESGDRRQETGDSRQQTGVDKRLSIVFVNDIEIAELNKRFRGYDKPTDVLAFPLTQNPKPKTQNSYIGEVIISTDTAKKQAEEYGHSFINEIIILTIHGILHILGYEHSKKMREKEDFYKNLFNTSLKFCKMSL